MAGCKKIANQREGLLTAPVVATPSPAAPAIRREMESFFSGWFKAHREKNIVVDDRAVGLAGNATRLSASVYEVHPRKDGAVSLEMEFHVLIPDGREIVEYVAGVSNDETKARKDCISNFVLSTYHVIYKSFINPEDPYQQIEPPHWTERIENCCVEISFSAALV